MGASEAARISASGARFLCCRGFEQRSMNLLRAFQTSGLGSCPQSQIKSFAGSMRGTNIPIGMLFLRYYLWIAPHLFLGMVVAGFLRRGLQKQLPIFSTYMVFALVNFFTLFGVSLVMPLNSYRWVLLWGMAVSSLLQFAVIYELASELILSRSSLAVPLRNLLRGVSAVLLLVAAGFSGAFSSISVQRVVNVLQVVDFASSVVRCGLLIILFVFTRALQISWRSRSAGIALGFGILASIELAGVGLRGAFGKSGYITVDLVQMAGFHVCVLIWLVYLFLPERNPAFTGRGLPESELALWDQELQRMVQR